MSYNTEPLQSDQYTSEDMHMLAETMKEGQHAYQQALQGLAMRLRGELILPGDPDFEAARGVWNGLADRHPALIVRCADVDDVIEAVNFAREQGIAVSVRCGGHSMVGYGTNDGGIVIDLSHMKAISS